MSTEEAEDYVRDLASTGRLAARTVITDAEASALVQATGWRSAYYLDALAQKMTGPAATSAEEAIMVVGQAVEKLLQPGQLATFGTWEEHIRKHYPDPDLGIAFAILRSVAPHPQGLSVDTILANIGRADLTRERLRAVVTRLHIEGFVTVRDWDGAEPACAFRNPLLRRWWHRYPQ